jgi:hypothetical protein
MKRLATATALLAALAAAPTAGAAEPAAGPCDTLLDDALRAIIMTREDLRFRTDYADAPDPFRLSAVDSLFGRPLDTALYVRAVAEELEAIGSLESMVVEAARELDVLLEPDDAWPEAAAGEQGTPWADALDALLPALALAASEMDSAFADLSSEERAFIAENARVLLEEKEFAPDKPIEVKDRETREQEEKGAAVLAIAARVRYERIARAGRVVARAVDLAIPVVERLAASSDRPPAPSDRALPPGVATGDVWDVVETSAGTIVIGGPGPTTYLAACAAIVDVGGDDTYAAPAGAAGPGLPAAVVIDVGGDDRYDAGTGAVGAGFMGVGAVADLAGDDSYRGGSFSLGSGLFGVGLLLDREGNDDYAGDTCVEGSGAFGIGLHVDEAGNDSYHGALFCQAFGFVKGFGLLYDASGNDLYFAGGKYTDEIRYFDHFLSLSQGFGFGWRPDASGGIGVLADEGGNDVYVSDIFGQGASYWFAIGGLVDSAGNDQYVSYQYAQGAATHLTVAALVDVAGNDNYVSKGVSQGCGHDLALGMLHDIAGDDSYACHDLSQGAGNANGIGVLFDDAGNDSYSVRNPANTQGYGDYRRDYGSVGILIDRGGKDSYSGRGKDGTWWRASAYGVGIDAECREVQP